MVKKASELDQKEAARIIQKFVRKYLRSKLAKNIANSKETLLGLNALKSEHINKFADEVKERQRNLIEKQEKASALALAALKNSKIGFLEAETALEIWMYT